MTQIAIPEQCAEIVNQVASQINTKSIWLGVLITCGVILVLGFILVYYLKSKGMIEYSVTEEVIQDDEDKPDEEEKP